ncbi:hypothetical protein QQP08_003650 [Theobroma cacao]|nr:hypothetical protein QQP08_003650 [Theobroma cacao]
MKTIRRYSIRHCTIPVSVSLCLTVDFVVDFRILIATCGTAVACQGGDAFRGGLFNSKTRAITKNGNLNWMASGSEHTSNLIGEMTGSQTESNQSV